MPLNYLQRVVESTNSEGIQISRPPNNLEIMDKINEIITFVNHLEHRKANKETPNPFGRRKTY